MEFEKNANASVDEDSVLKGRLVNWPECFYDEADSKTRLKLLQFADSEGLTPDDNVIRKRILDIRYDINQRTGTAVDNFLRAFMEIKYLSDNENNKLFFNRNLPKKVRKSLERIHYFEYCNDDTLRQYYCKEIYHMGRLYISLCKQDKQYSSLILGIGRMKEESLTAKIRRDMHSIAEKIPYKAKMEEELECWRDNLKDALFTVYPSERRSYELMDKDK